MAYLLSKRNKIFFLVIHIILGIIFSNFEDLSTYYAIGILIIGVYFILNVSDPHGHIPLYVSIYFISSEVLFRMLKVNLFWEFGKYSIILFFLLGFLRNKNFIKYYSIGIFFYFLLLLPSIIWVPYHTFSQWRQPVSFNLSGPACLTLCSLYCMNFSFNKEELVNLFYFALLPLITMSVVIFQNLPDFSSYSFSISSNPITSGGFGPNQVSTILGFGLVILFLGQFEKKYLTGSKKLDIIIIILFLFLGLISFSRGGMLAAFITSSLAGGWFFMRERNKIRIFSVGLIILIISSVTWFSLVKITEKAIVSRYTLSNVSQNNSVFNLTGRAQIFKADIDIFLDNIFTGVGPGSAYHLRQNYGYGKAVAAHTEYTRMLAEHGLLGLMSMIILFSIIINKLLIQESKSHHHFIVSFGMLAILTMLHSAMRLSFVGFVFGLMYINYEK